MRTRLIWVGRENRRDPEAVLCERYRERLRPYTRFDARVIKGVNGQSPDEVRQKEAGKILDALDDRAYVVLCDERGKQWSSPELAKTFQKQAHQGVQFVIGGSMGVADAVRNRADFVLSLSRMTLPHALARAVLMEQIYRAFTIAAGHPYHHEG